MSDSLDVGLSSSLSWFRVLLYPFLLLPQNCFYPGVNPLEFKYFILTFLAFVFQVSCLNIFFWFKNLLKCHVISLILPESNKNTLL